MNDDDRTRVHLWTRVRAVRHGVFAGIVVLVVCGVVAGVSAIGFFSATGRITSLTARGTGVITQTGVNGDSDTVRVRWTGQGSPARRTVDVPLDTTPPTVGTGIEVAYDPANPQDAIVPGAKVLADADSASDGMAFAVAVALGVLLVSAWRVLGAVLATRRPIGRTVQLRRIRVQRGLISRSWLETEQGDRWIPVYFDPALVTLPSPVTAQVHGDLNQFRFVAIDVPGNVTLHSSGPVSRVEPRGRRTDNPAEPDEYAADGASLTARLLRQVRADAVLLVPAPLVGLLWTFVLGTGFTGWLTVTVLVAALGLWWGALRGSDPS
jgi:hypothetical protein